MKVQHPEIKRDDVQLRAVLALKSGTEEQITNPHRGRRRRTSNAEQSNNNNSSRNSNDTIHYDNDRCERDDNDDNRDTGNIKDKSEHEDKTGNTPGSLNNRRENIGVVKLHER